MPLLRQKKLHLPSQEDDSLEETQHTTVATPEVEVSLVDRMKKRFKTRKSTASNVSTANSELETSSASSKKVPPTRKRGPAKKTSNKNSLGQKVIQIDKMFSPERSSKVFHSPTRFPKSKLSASEPSASEPSVSEPSVSEPSASEPSVSEPSVSEPSASEPSASEPSAGSESDDRKQTNQSTTSKARVRAKRSRGIVEEGGSGSQSSVERSANDSDHSKDSAPQSNEDTEAPSFIKKRRTDSDMTPSDSSKEGAKEAPPSHGEGEGMSEEEAAGSFREVPFQDAGMSTRKEKRTKKKGSTVMASEEMEAHLMDKEFIGNQIRVISTPFVLESGPRSWMQIWKGHQTMTHDVDPPDIPANVMDRIVSKINVHMEDVYQRLLGRQQQRNTLMSLDELRRDTQEQNQNSLGMGVKGQASLQEIISSYPSEWPGSVEEENEQMTERYSALKARLFALSRSLSVTKQQCEQYKALAGALERVDANLEKSGNLQKEVERTAELVSKIQTKLLGRDLTRAGNETQRGRNDTDNSLLIRLAPPTNHSALVKVLFKAATPTEST